MAGGGRRRRQKTRSSREIIEDDRSVLREQPLLEEAELESYLTYLPTELLERILSQLNVRDNIRASAVCRRWNMVATSVREPDKAPAWLIIPPKSGTVYEFYDPSKRISHFCNLPELNGSRFSYAKDGWLLMHNPTTHNIFFFYPYTHEKIELPNLNINGQVAAFSASPKHPNCVIFTISNIIPTIYSISTCHPGATHWTTETYQSTYSFISNIWNNIVFCKNVFYCFSVCGRLGYFNTDTRIFGILSAHPSMFPEDSVSQEQWMKGKSMAEHNGEMFYINTSGEKPIVYKLEQPNAAWIEMETLGNMTFFVNVLCCNVRADHLGEMRNRIFFPKVDFYGKRCASYSFDHDRFYPRKQGHGWIRDEPFKSIWIDAPEDLASFLER